MSKTPGLGTVEDPFEHVGVDRFVYVQNVGTARDFPPWGSP